MTTFSRHSYTATLDDDTALPGVGGQITLDAGAIPHVTASLTCAVEDAAILADLDPRDSRRITVGATNKGHSVPVYSPWAEQRRNRYIHAGFGFSNGSILVNLALYSGGYFPVTPGEKISVTEFGSTLGNRFQYGFTAALPGGGSALSNLVDVGNAATQVTDVTVPDGAAYMVIYVANNTNAVRVFAGTDIAAPFDGSTNPGGVLERTRWLGAVDASPSVMETRALIGSEWVPEDFRLFDLGIRSTTPNRADGTVTVELASDEAILGDFAQLADDKTPREHETSLRAVVGYVLDKIGAVLEPGDEDADVTAYWPVSLLNSNPAGQVNTAGYWTGSGASGLTTVNVASPAPALGTRTVRWTAAAGVSSVGVAGWDGTSADKEGRVTPGRRYGAVVRVLSNPGRSTTITLGFRDENGRHFSAVTSDAQVTSISEWTEFYLNAEAPPGAAYAYVSVTTTGNSAGQNHWVQAVLYEGEWRIPMFYGDSTDPNYTFAWSGDVNASPSERIPVVERSPEAFVWAAGVSGMDFLHPLLQMVGLRLVCDEQRRWTLRSGEYRTVGAQSWRYGVNITAADEALSRDDDSWFDGAVYVYVWTDADGIEQTRIDSYSLTATPTKVLRVELRDTPYPGPGRAKHIVTRAQGKGREVTISGIPSWAEHTDQPLSVLLDGTPIQTGIAARVRFDMDSDTVTVTSRTTDTPAAAWVLIPSGQSWLDSPVGASWKEEVI